MQFGQRVDVDAPAQFAAQETGGALQAEFDRLEQESAEVAGVQVAKRQDMLETTPDSWDRLLDVNTRGTFFLSQGVAKRMIADGAPKRGHRSMCYVSSVNSVMASVNRAEYCVSKAGVTMVAKPSVVMAK